MSPVDETSEPIVQGDAVQQPKSYCDRTIDGQHDIWEYHPACLFAG